MSDPIPPILTTSKKHALNEIDSSDVHPSKRIKNPDASIGDPVEYGYCGRFETWEPEHVILESLEGFKFPISMSTLSKYSTVFRQMLELPVVSGDPFLPIPVFVAAEDLYNLLIVIEELGTWNSNNSYPVDAVERHIKETIDSFSLKSKVLLARLADRFDCEVISHSTNQKLSVYYGQKTPLALLREASEHNLIEPARQAIRDIECLAGFELAKLHRQWWASLKDIRPSWQIELTRLIWITRQQLVDRPEEVPEYTISGRRRSRTRESIMSQTRRSYQEIADDFNPPSE